MHDIDVLTKLDEPSASKNSDLCVQRKTLATHNLCQSNILLSTMT